MSPYEMVREWHEKFAMPILAEPTLPPLQRQKIRLDMIAEECQKLMDGMDRQNINEVVEALAKLQYVIIGMSLEWGIPLEVVFTEVHRSTMSYVWPDGNLPYPSNYSKPDIAGVLERHQK